MRLIPRWSLFLKLSLSIGVVLLVVFGTASRITFDKYQEQARDATENRAILLTRTLRNAMSLVMASGGGHREPVQSLIETVGRLPGVEKLRVFDEEGKISYSAKREEIGRLTDELDYTVYRSPERSQPYQDEGTSYRSLCKVEEIPNEAQCQGCHDPRNEVLGALVVCLSMKDVEEIIRLNEQVTILVTGLSILLTAVLIAILLRRFVSTPVARLVKTMRSVESGKLDQRVDIRSSDEFGELGNSFNEMTRRLADAEGELERLHHLQLARADRLASLGEMAAGIAHEIKNPLAGLQGAAQVLKDDFPVEDPRRAVIEEMLVLLKRLDNSIKDLLNFSRHTEPSFVRISLNDVVEKVVFLVKQVREGKRANIVLDLDQALPPVEMDPDQLKQVFLNLFLNAIQAKPDGCTLTVRTFAEVPLDAGEEKRRAGYVMCSIADDGPGIPPDMLGRIFLPFVTTKEGGTGLGLPMTRKILDLHDGWITVQSEIGKGTTFRVFLPKTKA